MGSIAASAAGVPPGASAALQLPHASAKTEGTVDPGQAPPHKNTYPLEAAVMVEGLTIAHGVMLGQRQLEQGLVRPVQAKWAHLIRFILFIYYF